MERADVSKITFVSHLETGNVSYGESPESILMANWVFSGLKDKGVKDDPLVSVITQGKVEVFSSMVHSGEVDLSLVDGEGRTSLMKAAYVNFNELDRVHEVDPTRATMVKVLLESGAPSVV